MNIHEETDVLTGLILEASEKARLEQGQGPEAEFANTMEWPQECTVGPGLEGAIACESKVGYVNGARGKLVYCGYDIFDLCAYCTFEEVSYLLLHGELPNATELSDYRSHLVKFRRLPDVMRLLMGFPVENMSPMAALRLGTNLMRQKQTYVDIAGTHRSGRSIGADEDTDPSEIYHAGKSRATFEFRRKLYRRSGRMDTSLIGTEDIISCYHLIAGVSTIAAGIMRLHSGRLPLEADPELGHAANLLYMMTGRKPTPIEERIMDVCLILHADHGMNASTFASMVVASTLSDIYFAVGSGIAALNGPLHGGANEEVLKMLTKIGSPGAVERFYKNARKRKQKIMGFGHRVYKAYDPRARILKPLARYLTIEHPEASLLFNIAERLETLVISDLGKKKHLFPNVDFFSGLVYGTLGIPQNMFTTLFAISRVSGWTARILEYLEHNRIFRPRAIYIGPFERKCLPLDQRQ